MKYAIWKRNKEENQRIAEERVRILKIQIDKRKDEPELVRRYRVLIAKISKRYRLNVE